MKKLAIAALCACALTLPAFAQLNVGGYISSVWVPYRLTVPQEGDALHTTAVQAPWGEPDISAGLSFDGWSEFVGFHLGLDIAYGAKNQAGHPLSAKGSGWVWAKPFNLPYLDTLTVYLGNAGNDTLQGKVGGSQFVHYTLNTNYDRHKYRVEYQDSQANIFTKFDPYPWGNAAGTRNTYWPAVSAAVLLTWEPVKNLFVGAFFAPELLDLNPNWPKDVWIGGASYPTYTSINGDKLGEAGIDQDYYDVKKVYKKIQIGAGYDIAGVGFLRAQYIGMRNTIEAAFQVKALGDIMLDIGVKIPFEGSDKEDASTYKKKKDYQASIGVTYRNYDFRLTGRIDTAFLGSDSSGIGVAQAGLDLVAYLIPSYDLGFATIGADIGFEYEQKDDINTLAKDSMQAGVGAWIERNLGPGAIKAGVIGRLPLEWDGEQANFELFIPIFIRAGF
ncbi:MAG: hypothetical protein LBH85_08680 [Treponema sp.]|jgi:hypothetical protein|nr:hypothetical protein [Treponema sp.]